MSNFHQILQQQINVKILHLFFALTPLQMCLMKLDVQFVYNFWNGRVFWIENINLLKVDGAMRKAKNTEGKICS